LVYFFKKTIFLGLKMASSTKSPTEKPGARKRGAPKDAPLPGRGIIQRFHGVFNGFAVIVADMLEMWDLYDCGYYGTPS
jgi:hypothetical protein